jgi:hypothetical protein
MRLTLKIALACALGALLVCGLSPTVSADKPDWQKHIDWSIGNSTGPDQLDCPAQYAATEPHCATEGGRACLMGRAIDSAKHNNCQYAMRLTLITQCHNQGAQQALGAAGQSAVCDYLKTK